MDGLDSLTSAQQTVIQPQQRVGQESEKFQEVLGNDWLGGRDSNPDRQIQSLQSYRWTTSQRRRKDFREQEVFNTAQQILSNRVFAVGAKPYQEATR